MAVLVNYAMCRKLPFKSYDKKSPDAYFFEKENVANSFKLDDCYTHG